MSQQTMKELMANPEPMGQDQWAPNVASIKERKLNDIFLSVDLETPNKRGAGIFSIGIVPYHLESGEIFEEAAFYAVMDFREVLDHSSNTGDTMKWWMQQSNEARAALLNKHSLSYTQGIAFALAYIESVQQALNTNGDVYMVGNGSIFDIGKLEATAEQLGLLKAENGDEVLPYKFANVVDLRSFVLDAQMYAGFNARQWLKNQRKGGVHHNALWDAKVQAEAHIKCHEAMLAAVNKGA